MKFNPQKHHRLSNRLNGYDYTQPGAYFITIVTHQRENLFGEIVEGEAKLSDMGRIADENWRGIPEHFPQVELGSYVVMPNHVHGIITLHDGLDITANTSPSVGATHWVTPTMGGVNPTHSNGPRTGSIGAIIGAYKMAVTRRIQRETAWAIQWVGATHWVAPTNIWQRNYYDHIIRNVEEHARITQYIESNPLHWVDDEENSERNDHSWL